MTLAFEHALAPPRWLRPLRWAAAAAGLGGGVLAALQVHARWGLPGAAAVAVTAALLVAAGLLRVPRGRSACLLRVDAKGRARLLIDEREFDCVPLRWLLADDWVALTVRVAPPIPARPRRLDLLSGRRPHDDSWHRLLVWLAWLRRGSVPHGAFGSDD